MKTAYMLTATRAEETYESGYRGHCTIVDGVLEELYLERGGIAMPLVSEFLRCDPTGRSLLRRQTLHDGLQVEEFDSPLPYLAGMRLFRPALVAGLARLNTATAITADDAQFRDCGRPGAGFLVILQTAEDTHIAGFVPLDSIARTHAPEGVPSQ